MHLPAQAPLFYLRFNDMACMMLGAATMQGRETFLFVPHHFYSRIDLFLVDFGLLSRTTEMEINTITWSDHSSISLTLSDALSPGANPFLLQRDDSRKALETHLKELFVINVNSVNDCSALWNAHKALMWGIFIKIGAGLKRWRQKRIKELTDCIKYLEFQHKQAPSPSISHKLSQLRYDLRMCLLENFEKSTRRLKTKYYANGNKAGKILAQHIRGYRYNFKIPFIIHPTT